VHSACMLSTTRSFIIVRAHMCVGQQLYFLLFHKARSALKCAAPQSRSAADGFFAGVSFDFVADLRLKFVATA
jgi:hypothetical protein